MDDAWEMIKGHSSQGKMSCSSSVLGRRTMTGLFGNKKMAHKREYKTVFSSINKKDFLLLVYIPSRNKLLKIISAELLWASIRTRNQLTCFFPFFEKNDLSLCFLLELTKLNWMLNSISVLLLWQFPLKGKLRFPSPYPLVAMMCLLLENKILVLLIQLINYRLLNTGFRLGAQKDRWWRPWSTRAHKGKRDPLRHQPDGVKLIWARARTCDQSLVPCLNVYLRRLSPYSGKSRRIFYNFNSEHGWLLASIVVVNALERHEAGISQPPAWVGTPRGEVRSIVIHVTLLAFISICLCHLLCRPRSFTKQFLWGEMTRCGTVL